MFRHDARRLELIPFQENTNVSIPLPRDRLIKKIELYLSGTVTSVDPGAGTPGVAVEDPVAKLMPIIEVIGDGVAVLFRNDGQGLYYRNYLRYGCPPQTTAPGPAAGDHEINIVLTINFQNDIGIRPADTYLLASAFRSLELIVHWGSLADMFDTTRDFTQTMPATDGIRPVIYETTQPRPVFMRFQDFTDRQVVATTAEFEIPLTIGDRIYQNFMWRSTDAEANKGQTRSDAIINYIDIVTGENFRHYQMIPYEQLRAINEKDFSLEAMPTGICDIYTLEDGRIPSGLNVNDVNTAKVVMDVTVGGVTPTWIRQYNDIITPIKG